MNYSEIFAGLRKERGLTQAAVTDYLNQRSAKQYGFTSISGWEKGVALPPLEQFLLLCELYEVQDIQHTFRGVKRDYYGLEKLNSLGIGRAREYIAMLAGNPMFAEPAVDTDIDRPGRIVKLYDIPVAAGTGNYLDSDSYIDFEVDSTVPKETDYAVRVSGDSMTPRFIDGQIVFIKEQQTLEIGEVGIMVLDGDVYIKRLGHGELLSFNPRYAPIKLHEFSSLSFLGKVVG